MVHSVTDHKSNDAPPTSSHRFYVYFEKQEKSDSYLGFHQKTRQSLHGGDMFSPIFFVSKPAVKAKKVHQILGGTASILCITCSSRVSNSPEFHNVPLNSKVRSPGVLQ